VSKQFSLRFEGNSTQRTVSSVFKTPQFHSELQLTSLPKNGCMCRVSKK